MMRLAPFLILLCGLLVDCSTTDVRTPSTNRELSAHELERRLMAPCCWRETLDTHSSPLASQLRAEIRDRFAKGDSPQGIENDLAARFGPRIRAELPQTLGFWLMISACSAGGLLLAWMAHRVRLAQRRSTHERTSSALAGSDTKYEWQLDQDLLDD
jgi:cytochrome c-type biogenesis protein CcmH